MKSHKIILFFLLVCAGHVRAQEEFAGPFASWANVVTRFQAKGDGIQDDTRALQNALDNLFDPVSPRNTPGGNYSIIYLPKGTYKISRTLQLRGKIGVSIIGEDPANTIIKWFGPENDTVLWTNGSAYFRISRLTVDANNRKGIEGIGIHWKEKWNNATDRSYASLNNEISDIIFNGTAIGIGGGTSSEGTNSNDSEITIRRCTFNKCVETGIRITGYNALNYWIWYCRFFDCNLAITCVSGNFHVMNSYFKGSTLADIIHTNSYYTSVRGCLSSGSRMLSWDNGSSCNPFKRIFQGNIILKPEENPIGYHHLGSVTMIDNILEKSRNPTVARHMNIGSWCPGNYQMLSIHNRYDYPKPINFTTATKEIFSYSDSTGTKITRTEAEFLKALPSTPPKITRKIYEVPANANFTVIQQMVNKAAADKGLKSIVHFGVGKYYCDQPLIIPKGSDLQLIGDGLLYATTILKKNNSNPQPLLVVKGPSYITLRDLQLGDAGGIKNNSPVVVFENVDQRSASVFIDQLYSLADTSLYVNGLNYLYVEKNNSFFSGGNFISGGKIQKTGGGTLQVNCFGGQFAYVTVLNNANFVSKDCWWEGLKGLAMNLQGEGNVTIDGAMVAPTGADSSPVISIKNFAGKVSLLNMYVQGALDINPKNEKLEIMSWNVHFYFKTNPIAFIQQRNSYRGLFFGITAQCFNLPGMQCVTMDPFSVTEKSVNITRKDDFVKSMTMATRKALPRVYGSSREGVSNVYVSRITVGAANRGIEFINR
ncbi:MAG TPA: glycosyl hydrolase family 28-related protein [Flavitalea sp.]|nr:glycosyl hydrolase family 28-related protein [Flavitalea sp.]